MPKAHTWEWVNEFFISEGCQLLTDHYKTMHQKLAYICRCGKRHERTLATVRAKGICNNRVAYTEYDIRQMFADKNKEYLEEAGRAKNKKKLYRYRCKCGNISTCTLDDLKTSKSCCYICRNLRIRKQFDDVCALFASADLTVDSEPGEYENNQSRLKCRCNKCGFVGATTYAMVQQGKKPCECNKLIGDKHPLFNPNLTPEERKLRRRYTEYDVWRFAIYKRDSYTCKCCGKHGGKINAHHLYGYNDREDLRTDMNNGITLCQRCHTIFHSRYGRINNTPEQYYEFQDIYREQLGIYDVHDMKGGDISGKEAVG